MKRKQEVLHERQKSRELLCMRIYKPGAEKKARKTFFLLCVCACVKNLRVRQTTWLSSWKCCESVCAGVCWPAGSATGCPRCERLEKWSEWSRMKQLAHPPFYDTEERKEGRKEREWRGRRVRGRGGKEGGRENQKQTVDEGKEGK